MCNGVWFPELHLAKGFNLFASIGANYQGGLLENEVRAGIQYVHRIGAVVIASYVLILSILILLRSNARYLRALALLLIILVCAQFVLGIMNVIYLLPIEVAVAHNGVAALLLATIFSMLHFTRRENNAC